MWRLEMRRRSVLCTLRGILIPASSIRISGVEHDSGTLAEDDSACGANYKAGASAVLGTRKSNRPPAMPAAATTAMPALNEPVRVLK